MLGNLIQHWRIVPHESSMFNENLNSSDKQVWSVKLEGAKSQKNTKFNL
jgi:hypothetical protein